MQRHRWQASGVRTAGTMLQITISPNIPTWKVSSSKWPCAGLQTRHHRSLRRPRVAETGLVNMVGSSLTARHAKAICCVCICGIRTDVLRACAPVPWAPPPVRVTPVLSSSEALVLCVYFMQNTDGCRRYCPGCSQLQWGICVASACSCTLTTCVADAWLAQLLHL